MDDGYRWVTIPGRGPVKIKTTNEYMNDLIRNKAKVKLDRDIEKDENKEKDFNENYILKDADFSKDYVMYENFFGYQSNLDKKLWNEKEKAIDQGYGFLNKQIEVIDKKTGSNVGRLWYREFEDPSKWEHHNRIWVDKIEVHPDHRRKGIATQMYKELQKRAGDEEIYFGELTTPGKKLLDSIATITKVKEASVKKYNKYWGRIK